METKYLIVALAGLLLSATAYAMSPIPVKAECPEDTTIVGETTWANAFMEDRTVYDPIYITGDEVKHSGPLYESSKPVEECRMIYG